MIKTYSELITIDSYKERFEYLKLSGSVGIETFGFDRYLNQVFYTSQEWRSLRNQIIIRDKGCDMAMEGYEIFGKILVHHMNPITAEDIQKRRTDILNPEYLICVSHETHNAIHYGDGNLLRLSTFVERKPNDTKLW